MAFAETGGGWTYLEAQRENTIGWLKNEYEMLTRSSLDDDGQCFVWGFGPSRRALTDDSEILGDLLVPYYQEALICLRLDAVETPQQNAMSDTNDGATTTDGPDDESSQALPLSNADTASSNVQHSSSTTTVADAPHVEPRDGLPTQPSASNAHHSPEAVALPSPEYSPLHHPSSPIAPSMSTPNHRPFASTPELPSSPTARHSIKSPLLFPSSPSSTASSPRLPPPKDWAGWATSPEKISDLAWIIAQGVRPLKPVPTAGGTWTSSFRTTVDRKF